MKASRAKQCVFVWKPAINASVSNTRLIRDLRDNLIDPSAVSAPVVTVDNPLAGKASGATTGLAGDPNDPMSPHDSGIYVYTTDHDRKPSMVELERTAYQGAKT
jgi:hypothetical protein